MSTTGRKIAPLQNALNSVNRFVNVRRTIFLWIAPGGSTAIAATLAAITDDGFRNLTATSTTTIAVDTTAEAEATAEEVFRGGDVPMAVAVVDVSMEEAAEAVVAGAGDVN